MGVQESDNWFLRMGRLCQEYPQLLETFQQYHGRLQYGHTIRIESIDFKQVLGKQTMWIFTKAGKRVFVDSAFGGDHGYGKQIGKLLRDLLKQMPTMKTGDIKEIFLLTERGHAAFFSTISTFSEEDFATYLIN